MSAIFLSASVPVVGRGNFHEDADPFLIQYAVRELVTIALGRRTIVWGGHPAITPMVWAVCQDLGVNYNKAVDLYQSRFFSDQLPEENRYFESVNYTDAVPGDRGASLDIMRSTMLSRSDLSAAVFIGGMDGIFAEHQLFAQLHPTATVLAVAAPGGAARQLAGSLDATNEDVESVDFVRLFHEILAIDPDEPRDITD